MTTVAELLGHDLERGLDAELKRIADNDGGSGLPFRLLRRHAAEAVTAVLDIDIGALALDAWAKYDRLNAAARRSSEPGAEPERVRIVEHQITSTHEPALEILVNGAHIATIDLGLEVEIDVHGLDAEIRDARLTALRTGDVDVRATLSVKGRAVVERERSYEIGALLPLGAGIPLTTTASGPAPARASRRRRRSRVRGILTLVAVIAVLGLGAAAARSTGGTISVSVESGVGGVVRPGSEWFVREQATRRSPDVATVRPGEPVRVACLDRGWAKLITPHEGKYVYSRGLSLESTPPACPA